MRCKAIPRQRRPDDIPHAPGCPNDESNQRIRDMLTIERMVSRTSPGLSIPTSFPMSASPSVRYVAVSFLISHTGARSIAWLTRPQFFSCTTKTRGTPSSARQSSRLSIGWGERGEGRGRKTKVLTCMKISWSLSAMARRKFTCAGYCLVKPWYGVFLICRRRAGRVYFGGGMVC